MAAIKDFIVATRDLRASREEHAIPMKACLDAKKRSHDALHVLLNANGATRVQLPGGVYAKLKMSRSTRALRPDVVHGQVDLLPAATLMGSMSVCADAVVALLQKARIVEKEYVVIERTPGRKGVDVPLDVSAEAKHLAAMYTTAIDELKTRRAMKKRSIGDKCKQLAKTEVAALKWLEDAEVQSQHVSLEHDGSEAGQVFVRQKETHRKQRVDIKMLTGFVRSALHNARRLGGSEMSIVRDAFKMDLIRELEAVPPIVGWKVSLDKCVKHRP
jgi:hypothetical protein